MTRRTVLAACLALVLVFVVRWQWPDDRGTRFVAGLPDPRFDYSLTDFTARFLDAQGRVEMLLSGPRLEHDSALKMATVFEPRFHIEPEGANWQGRAERALLLREADEMILEGRVRLSRPSEHGELQILTERLHHHTRARTIVATSPVEVRQPGSFVHAGGALLRLDDDLLEFSNHVQGELHPGRSGPEPDHDHGQR